MFPAPCTQPISSSRPPETIRDRGASSVAFETDEWGRAVVPSLAEVAGLVDARLAFARADIASARLVDSRPKFDYEYRYDAEPVVLPTWRAYLVDESPSVDGQIHQSEWPGWDRSRTIPLVSLADEASAAAPAGEAYALFDGKDLHLAVRVTAHGDGLAADGNFVEVDLARVLGRRVAAPFVLRGHASGRLENVTRNDVDAESAERFADAVEFAAHALKDGSWSSEFRIPLSAIGVAGESPAELRFNTGLRQTGAPGGPWFAAAKPSGEKEAFVKAGTLQLDQTVRADAANLITGGSFESDDLLPWRTSSNAREPLPEGAVTQVRQGIWQDGCIRFHADDSEAMTKRVIKWTYPMAKAAPGRYCLSYYVRVVGEGLEPQTDMGSLNSYVRVQQKGGAGGNVGQRPSMLTTTHDQWIRRDLIVNLPLGMEPSMVSLQLHQACGTVLVDDVSLLRCED